MRPLETSKVLGILQLADGANIRIMSDPIIDTVLIYDDRKLMLEMDAELFVDRSPKEILAQAGIPIKDIYR